MTEQERVLAAFWKSGARMRPMMKPRWKGSRMNKAPKKTQPMTKTTYIASSGEPPTCSDCLWFADVVPKRHTFPSTFYSRERVGYCSKHANDLFVTRACGAYTPTAHSSGGGSLK